MVKTLLAGLAPQKMRGFVGVLAAMAAATALADAVTLAAATPSASHGPSAAPLTAPPPPAATTNPPLAAASNPVPLPAGQVWECMVNGQRTFSDVRCGAQSSIRQLGPINIMDASSTRSSARYGLYQTGYSPRPAEPAAPPDDNAADYPNEAYWGPAVIAIRPHPIRGHQAPHNGHGHTPSRKN